MCHRSRSEVMRHICLVICCCPAPFLIYKELSVLSRLSIQPKPLHDQVGQLCWITILGVNITVNR